MKCWVCVDAKKIGTWKQAEALAEKWIGNYEKKPVILPKWCRWVPSRLFLALPAFLKNLAVKDFGYPLPDIIIAAGRQGVLVAIALKHKVKTVVLMNPGVNTKNFDVVIAPIHDQLNGRNVISTQGAIHSIDPNTLNFPKYLQNYPNPRIGVLLGGNSIHGTYEESLAINLANDLRELSIKHNSCLIITPSRRTPISWLEVFEKNLNGVQHWIWDQKSPNPYPDLLAGLDFIVVCEDSISMASEACVIGKPVLIYPTGIKKPKFKRFYQKLFEEDYAQRFSINAIIDQPLKLKEIDSVIKKLNIMFK